jgi:DEAD/DEAH box helicase domain-containing protein
VLASATIANPAALAERLTGLRTFTVIERDGLSGRRSARSRCGTRDHRPQSSRRAAPPRGGRPNCWRKRLSQGARTIVFIEVAHGRRADVGSSRQLALEDIGTATWDGALAPTARLHRPSSARELERRLVEGELLGVVSTDALELGIDIGSLDAAICVTFPGTVASLRQMWGRAGRRGRGLAVYVAGEDALDQFFCRHPDEFLDRPVEAAILDHENEQIHAAHMLCAAHEGPLDASDDATLGPGWRPTAERLVSAGELRRRPNGTFVPRRTDGFPAVEVSPALGEPRQRRDRRRASGRAASASVEGARRTPRSTTRGVPAPGTLLRGPRARLHARHALVEPHGRLVHAAQRRRPTPTSRSSWTAGVSWARR